MDPYYLEEADNAGRWTTADAAGKRNPADEPDGTDNADSPAPAASTITNREFEVLALRAQGYALKETAAELGIAVNTVKALEWRLYSKLGVGSVTEACWRLGWMRVPTWLVR